MVHSEGGVALLPHVPVLLKTLKSQIPVSPPQHLGDHLRCCRIKRKLTQGEAADCMATQTLNVSRWERGKEPEIEAMPGILKFLGYDPFPTPRTLPERMLAKRRVMGWTFKEAAARFGVHRKRWKAWEQGESIPQQNSLSHLERFLKVPN
ncbi:MAG TPA: hypothetical protein DCQ83_06740 [Fibrobacteres bacterium]|nr:hypothetical protein [Fibrobacterota bacterium]